MVVPFDAQAFEGNRPPWSCRRLSDGGRYAPIRFFDEAGPLAGFTAEQLAPIGESRGELYFILERGEGGQAARSPSNRVLVDTMPPGVTALPGARSELGKAVVTNPSSPRAGGVRWGVRGTQPTREIALALSGENLGCPARIWATWRRAA